jgi:hypothetical protein
MFLNKIKASFIELGGEDYSHHWFQYTNLFRYGNFMDRDELVKSAWFVFCEKILIYVNKKWRTNAIQANTHLSDVCTVSDEAYAYQVARTNLHFWMKKMFVRTHTGVCDWKEIGPFEFDAKGQKRMDSFEEGPGLEYESGDRRNKNRVGNNGDKAVHGANRHRQEDDDTYDEDEDDDVENGQNQKKKKYAAINNALTDEEVDCINDDQEVTPDKEKEKDRINKQEYYTCFSILLKAKRSNKEDWMSWDQAYKAYIGKPKQMKPSARLSVASSISSKSKDDGLNAAEEVVDDIEFESW